MAAPFIIGWQEWLALPDLGLPAIKAKIDTGARTSALHAFLIEPFGPATAPMVRFGVHPIPGRLDIAIFCSAAIADRREVTSSNGEKETRYFIQTAVTLGERSWPIEIGLTNRESMTYRMLLGRQGIRDDMMVDAAASFRQPRLNYKLYRGVPRQEPVRRSLRIALVARDVQSPFNRKLAATAALRGHTLELLEFEQLALTFDDDIAGMTCNGELLAHYDAVIPRIGRREGAGGAAMIRQLEDMGSVALNSGNAIDRLANPIAVAQALTRHRVPQALTLQRKAAASDSEPAMLRALVAGDSAAGMITRRGERVRNAGLTRHRAERRLAEHAAAALGLGLAAIDIDATGERPVVAGISTRPLLGTFAKATGADVALAVIEAAEARMMAAGRPRPREDTEA